MKQHRNEKKYDQIKIENPETENSQIPAPLYVNKTGKVETGVANLCRKILRIALQKINSISFSSIFVGAIQSFGLDSRPNFCF